MGTELEEKKVAADDKRQKQREKQRELEAGGEKALLPEACINYICTTLIFIVSLYCIHV